MSALVAQYGYGWISIPVLLALSYAVGRWHESVVASQQIGRVKRSDEGRTGQIAAIWRDDDQWPVCTVVLNPRSTQPSLLVLCQARMPGLEWREGQDIVIRNGRVEPVAAG